MEEAKSLTVVTPEREREYSVVNFEYSAVNFEQHMVVKSTQPFPDDDNRWHFCNLGKNDAHFNRVGRMPLNP